MTWQEVRVDSKGRKSVVKHKGEKPAHIPNLSDKHKTRKAHVLPRGGEPYIETRGVRPYREVPLEVPYGHAGRSTRPVSRDSDTTILISIHPDDSVSSRGIDDHERPTTPHGYGRDGARRGYDRPASRPVSRDATARNTDVAFPSRAPSRHVTKVSTADFTHGTGPISSHAPSRHAESVTRGRDPRPLSRASAPDYDNSPVPGHKASRRALPVLDEHGRSGYDAPLTPRTPYNVVEVKPKRLEHSPTRRILEGRHASARTGRGRSPQRGPSEAGEMYDRHLQRSFRNSQFSASAYSQQ